MNEIKKILVPIDFSKNALKIFKSAVYVAKKFKAELCVVYVVESLDAYSGFAVPHISIAQFQTELHKSAENKMTEFIEGNAPQDVSFKNKVLVGDVVEEIKNYAESEKYDLIIIGTHGYKGLEKSIFGSVAGKVLTTAPCPVLTINPYK